MENENKIIGAVWFETPVSTIGIVLIQYSSNGLWEAFIGQCRSSQYIRNDMKIIIEQGAKFPFESAIQAIKDRGKWYAKHPFNDEQ